MPDKPPRGTQGASDLTSYAIFEKPLDHPDKFVVRAFHIVQGEQEPVPDKHAELADSLEEARKHVPYGMVRVARMEQDPPFLVETWI